MDKDSIMKQVVRIEEEISGLLKRLYEAVDSYLSIGSYKNTVYFLDTEIRELNFGCCETRIQRCLKYNGITTIGSMAEMSCHELLGFRNIGLKSLRSFFSTLTDYGKNCGLTENDLIKELVFYKELGRFLGEII